jgi:cytochrome P450
MTSIDTTGFTQRDRELSMYQLAARPSRDTAHELFTRIAAQDPVHWDPYTKTWLVAEREAAVQVLGDQAFSSRADRLIHPDLRHGGPGPALAEMLTRQLMFLDGQAHARLRPVIDQVLSARRVRGMADEIGALTERACKAADAAGELDAVRDVAAPVPLAVITRLLGLPAIEAQDLWAMSDAYVDVITGIDRTVDTQTLSKLDSFLSYALDVVRCKRRMPAEDGVSELVARADALGGYTDLDLAVNLIMLISAGHQTTTGLIAGAVAGWCGPPTGTSGGPTRRTGSHVEAELAYVSPSQFIARTATEDRWVSGRMIEAGQSVLVLLAAVNWTANRRASRSGKASPVVHLAFGHGAHRCPGARLARLEAGIVLDLLHRAKPAFAAGDVRWSPNLTLPCPVSLPVRVSDST